MSTSVKQDNTFGEAQRIDRWLWCARLLKNRSLAAALAQSGRLRINGERIGRTSRQVRPGDVLTFPLGPHVRVIKVLAFTKRRGPAREARALYEDLQPPPSQEQETEQEN